MSFLQRIIAPLLLCLICVNSYAQEILPGGSPNPLRKVTFELTIPKSVMPYIQQRSYESKVYFRQPITNASFAKFFSDEAARQAGWVGSELRQINAFFLLAERKQLTDLLPLCDSGEGFYGQDIWDCPAGSNVMAGHVNVIIGPDTIPLRITIVALPTYDPPPPVPPAP